MSLDEKLELTTPSASGEISTIKLPQFWASSPVGWFIQAEAIFETARIVRDQTKYIHLLSAMAPETFERVMDIIQDPPAEDRYKYLKGKLI